MPRCAAWDPVFLLPPGLAALGTSLQGRGLQHVAPSWTPAHSATTLRDDAFSFQNAPGFPLKQLEHQLPNLRSSGAKGKAAGLSGAPPPTPPRGFLLFLLFSAVLELESVLPW